MNSLHYVFLVFFVAIAVNAQNLPAPDAINLQEIVSVETVRKQGGHLVHKIRGLSLSRSSETIVIDEEKFDQRPVQYRLIQLCLRRLESARRLDKLLLTGEKVANSADRSPGEVEFIKLFSCRVDK